MSGWWWLDVLGVAAGLVLAWLALLVALVIARPRGGLLREALRLLPDLLRLLPRLAVDRSLPRGVRAGLAALLAYLAFPLDLVRTSSPCWATPTMPSSWPRYCAGWCDEPESTWSGGSGREPRRTGSPPCAALSG